MNSQLIYALVLATVVLVKGDHVKIPRFASACEGEPVSLDCSDLLIPQYIEITSALYQRENLDICAAGGSTAGWDTSCSADVSMTLMTLCGGSQTCPFTADDATLGTDPCDGTPKYLNVTYDCVEEHIPCEELPDECHNCCHYSPCSVTCGHGVAQAIYGCVDRTTQSFLYPSLCTIECCIEPCPYDESPLPGGGHCYEHYPHIEVECDHSTIYCPTGP